MRFLLRVRLVALVAGLIALSASNLPAQEPLQNVQRVAVDWGEIQITVRGLALHVADARLPSSGILRIPRLNNPVAAIYLEGDPDKAPLQLTPLVAEWEITLPMAPGRFGRIAVIVETVGRPRLTGQPQLIHSAAGGVVTLPAHAAQTFGENLRYEPQPHKNTVGYWSRQEDYCAWQFSAPPGRYEVQILQGCGKGQGGSEVVARVGDQELAFTVEETGHFQNFKNRSLGTIELSGHGEHTLELRPRTKKAGAVMDVRQMRLLPVADLP